MATQTELFDDGTGTPADVLPEVPDDETPEVPAPPATPDYVFVQLPGGKIVAVPRDELVIATSTQDIPAPKPETKVEVHFYVHLADGSVERVKEEDLPPAGGTNAPLGFWRRGDSVYTVTGVYPVESTVTD